MPFFGGGGGDYHIIVTNIKGGTDAAPSVTGSNNMALGNGALQNALLVDYTVAIGNNAGNAFNNVNGESTFIGYGSGNLVNGGNTTIIGAFSAHNSRAEASVIIGDKCVYSSNIATAPSLTNSVVVGTYALSSSKANNVSNTVIVGHGAQLGDNSASNCVVIGTGAYVGNIVPGGSISRAVVVGDTAAALSFGVAVGALAKAGSSSIAIGAGITAADNEIKIGDNSYTSVVIGGITLSGTSGTAFPSAIIGDPGTEGAGIVIGGVTYDSAFKVSDISSADIAQSIIHRHSLTWEPIQVFARSNSNGSGHGVVTNGMALSSVYTVGWTGTEYNLASRIHTEVSATGTVSDTSMPADLVFSVTPDGSAAPVEAVRIKSDKTTQIQAGIQFPATAVPSTDPNTLDDYEEGTFTPTFTCATPGDLAIVYTAQSGDYQKIGNRVYFSLEINFTPTFTTASGAVRISGLPFNINASAPNRICPAAVAPWTAPAGMTALTGLINGADSTFFRINKQNNAGGGGGSMEITEMTSGSASLIRMSGFYSI